MAFAWSQFFDVPSAQAGGSCPTCASEIGQATSQVAVMKQMADLVLRNKKYLAGLSSSDASKTIKVKSNILIAGVKEETARNNACAARKAIVQKGCQACQPTEPKDCPSPTEKKEGEEG